MQVWLTGKQNVFYLPWAKKVRNPWLHQGMILMFQYSKAEEMEAISAVINTDMNVANLHNLHSIQTNKVHLTAMSISASLKCIQALNLHCTSWKPDACWGGFISLLKQNSIHIKSFKGMQN